MAGEIIRPSALATERTTPVASELMVVDNGVTVAKSTIENVVKSGRPAANQAEAEAGTDPNKAMTPLTTKQAIAAQGATLFATAAQGSTADTAVQPGDLATVATSGDYTDLSNLPTLGTAAATDATAYATAAQGALADTATQPGDLATVATTGDYDDLTNKPTLGTAAAADTGDFAAAAQAVPAGGTTGQVLAKASNTDNDLEWTAAGVGDMLAANNLSDLANADTALTNLGGTATGTALFKAATATAASQIVVGDTHIDMVARYGLIGGGDSGDAAKIQDAFDNAPIGATLHFPPGELLVTTVPLVMNRLLHLDLGTCAIRGDFTGQPTYDVLQVNINDAGVGITDVRGMVISGGRIYCNGGGRAAININTVGDGSYFPHFQTIIEKGNHAGWTQCIRIGGSNVDGDTNFCIIRDSNLGTSSTSANYVINLDGCADGHRILNNLIYGYGAGVRTNLVEGAYQTAIERNAIVSRDGSLLVTNGARIVFKKNQCEQQGGVNTLGSMVLVQGLDYISHGNIFEGNNFGGGANVNTNMTLFNARGNDIDKNYWFPAAVQDINFADGGSGLVARNNTLGGHNWCRGTRSQQSAPTDISRRMIIAMAAGAIGNRGVWRADVSYNASWVSSSFEFMVDSGGICHFEGAMDSGTATGGTIMAVLPLGCRPRGFTACDFVSETGAFAYVTINSSGQIAAGNLPVAPNQRFEATGISFPVNWLDAYDIGA